MKFNITKRLREPPFGTETSERRLMTEAADEIDTLRAKNERLREELACTIEELINHTGDDMIDSRQARVSELRSGARPTNFQKQSRVIEALHDLLTRPTDPAARERARAALSEAQL